MNRPGPRQAARQKVAEPARPYTPKSLAELWQMKVETVRRRIAEGELKAFRVGRALRIPRAEVAEFEERNATPGKETDEEASKMRAARRLRLSCPYRQSRIKSACWESFVSSGTLDGKIAGIQLNKPVNR